MLVSWRQCHGGVPAVFRGARASGAADVCVGLSPALSLELDIDFPGAGTPMKADVVILGGGWPDSPCRCSCDSVFRTSTSWCSSVVFIQCRRRRTRSRVLG